LIYKIKKMVGREGFGSLAGRPSVSNPNEKLLEFFG